MKSKKRWMSILKNRRFPLFIDSEGQKVLVIGAGTIAKRRVTTLLKFDFDIEVVAPMCCDEIKGYAKDNLLKYTEDVYDRKYISDQLMILACTDDRDTNYRIISDAKEAGILANACDCRGECDFFFPAIAVNDDITVGISGSGNSHDITKKSAAVIRGIVERKDY